MLKIDNEICCLSCAIMHDKAQFIVEQLTDKDFMDTTSKYIFNKIKLLVEADIPIDVEAIIDEQIDPKDLSIIINRVPTGANFQYYINVMLENSRLMKMREIGEDLVRKSKDKADSREVINEIQAQLNHMVYDKDGFVSSDELMEEVGKPNGKKYLTGFADYDRRIGGLFESDLIIIGARPSMGKTALAMSIMLNLMQSKVKIGFFSLEMSLRQIGQRFISMYSEISHECIKLGNMQGNDISNYNTAVSELRQTDIVINDRGGLNVYEIKSQIRQLYNEDKLDIVFIDYLQLIYGTGKEPSREREVTFIVQELKNLAKELHIPIVLLSQLNRSPEARSNNKPKLSDLRESGSIEQIADVVILLYREYYYTQNVDSINENYMLIEKNRNGATGSIQMTFESDFVKFKGITWNA